MTSCSRRGTPLAELISFLHLETTCFVRWGHHFVAHVYISFGGVWGGCWLYYYLNLPMFEKVVFVDGLIICPSLWIHVCGRVSDCVCVMSRNDPNGQELGTQRSQRYPIRLSFMLCSHLRDCSPNGPELGAEYVELSDVVSIGLIQLRTFHRINF